MILYVLIVLALASFVIAFFSARTWHWAYVVVVEALFLATVGFFLLASETVRINAVLRAEVNRTQKQLDTFEAQNDALRRGTKDTSMLSQLGNEDPPVKTTKDDQGNDEIASPADLDSKLLIATRLRGQVWRNVTPAAPPNAQTGAVTVNVPTSLPAAPAGTKPEPVVVVYMFDDGSPQPPAANGVPRGPQYLGEFTAVQAGPKQAKLQPVLPLDNFERQRLAASRGPWIIYETMPMDRHEIFAGKSEQELKQKLPAKSLAEYLRDGKPATPDDDPARVVGYDAENKRLPPADIAKATKKVYQRRLRDYAAEFDEMARRRVAILAEIDAVTRDIARLDAAQNVAKKLQAFREDERKKLTSDLAGVNKERDAIQKHLDQLNKLLVRARELTADMMRRNDRMAAELAARQLRPRQPGNGSTSPSKAAGPLALGSR